MIILLWQGEKIGTLSIQAGKLVLDGDQATLKGLVQELQKKGESPEAFLARLPKLLHGTLSAVEQDGK